MKINAILKTGIWGLALLFCCQSNTKVVEYFEDAYTQQAPQELVAQVEHIAQKIGFDKDYQIVVPKKPGLQINPLNKLLTYGINPQNKTPFVLINPEWFATLTKDQQTFLIGRSLLTLQHSNWMLPVKLLPWVWIITTLLLALLLFFAIKRTRFGSKPVWMRILAIYLLFAVANFAFLTALYNKVHVMLGRRFDKQMAQLALEKTGQDRQVAVSTYQAMDDFVKKELAAGDTFWKPFENTFSDIIERLK